MNPSQQILHQLKQSGATFSVTYPGAKIKRLYELVHANFESVSVSKEEEGVGICAGVSLTGGKPFMLIQSTGLGNMVNALCSLTLTYKLPLLILASWRGVYNETIAAQIALGEKLPKILNAINCRFTIINTSKDIPKISAEAQKVFENSSVHVILLNPRLWETSPIEPESKTPYPSFQPPNESKNFSKYDIGTLTRFDILKLIAPHLKGKIVVSNIGVPSRELYSILDQPSNFYMLGSLGLVSSIGFGVSLTSPKQVFVIDGDGSLLSNLGSLATIASVKPPNLTVIAIDNRVHGSTGNQPTATGSCVDLAETSRSLGFQNVYRGSTTKQLIKIFKSLGSGPNFIHVPAQPGNADVPVIPLSPLEIKQQFMSTL